VACAPAPAGPQTSSRLQRPAAAWWAFLAMGCAALAFLLWEGRGNTFFYDEWSWIEFRHSGLSAILSSYNEHMELVPLAVYQLLFHTIGIAHYRYYRALAALAHVGCATAIFAYARRRIGPAALALAPPLLLFGAGWEFILWGVNFGFTASIALSVAALLALDGGDRRAGVRACALLVGGLLFSETALVFAAGVAVELTWRDRGLRRFWVWALPLVLYLCWWLVYYRAYLSEHDPGAMPGFIARLAAAAAGAMFGHGISPGWGVLAAIGALLCWRVGWRGALRPRLAGLLVSLAAFWVLVAYGRAQLGDPTASRYVYTGALLLLLVVLEALAGVRMKALAAVGLAALCGFSLAGNLAALGDGESFLHTGSRTEAAELTALGLVRRHVPTGFVLDPHWAPQIFAGRYFAAVRALGSTPADSVATLLGQPEAMRAAADDVLLRAGEVRLVAASRSAGASSSAPVVELALKGRLSRTGACVHFVGFGAGATIDLLLPAGGLSLRTLGGRAALPTAVRLRRFASGYENAPFAQLDGPQAVVLAPRPDRLATPWHVRISPWQPLLACSLA